MPVHNNEIVDTFDELRKAARDHKIRDLEGFGEKTEQSILEGITRINEYGEQIKLSVAEQIIEPLLQYLMQARGVKNIEIAGSNRRKKETVGINHARRGWIEPGDVINTFGLVKLKKLFKRR
jgi:DNA polymerase/3'-5' exonuclease PolX